MLYKLSDLVFKFSLYSQHWPKSMHEPVFVGILLLLLSRNPWTLQRTLLLVGMEQNLRQVLSMGEANGGDILRQLLQVLRRLASMPEDVALKVIFTEEDGG
jgi:hypothetical protein